MIRTTAFVLLALISGSVCGQYSGISRTTRPGEENRNYFSPLIRSQQSYLDTLYYKSITIPDELINGKEYIPYYFGSGTNPLLFSNVSRRTTLFFRDVAYKNINLHYDTYLDEIVYYDNNRKVDGMYPQIILNKDNIRGFNLYFDNDSMVFRRYSFPAEYSGILKDGYYEVGYEGKSLLLIRHQSKIYNKEGVNKYKYSPTNYVFINGTWQKIASRSGFLKMFGEKEKEISSLVRHSKINVKKATREQISGILRYFDSGEKGMK
ncbi:MAG TPA: hypothetical protein VMT63_00215 [Bacteroidales bacterium]|nr:hypothetical protein [Bacteroidales bacterium]